MLAYLTFISVVSLQICCGLRMPEPKYEMFTVLVSFFSGRNNPEWVVKYNRTLTELMVNARKAGKIGLPAQMPARLGYRGILVEDKITKIPGLLVGPQSTKLQIELLGNIPKKMKFKSGDLEEIINTIRGGKINFEKIRGKRYAPHFDPAQWNEDDGATRRRQRCNNCYNYATMIPTDNWAQPGLGGGKIYTKQAMTGQPIPQPHTADNLIRAAEIDGLTQLHPHPGPYDPVPRIPVHGNRHLVALVVKPDLGDNDGDFHWYRLDSNNRWSHKPGETKASQTDNQEEPIFDPRCCDRGLYKFARFMLADSHNPHVLNIQGDYACPV